MQTIKPSFNNQFWVDSPLELRFLGLMVSLPFLVPYHLPPIASFYSEFVALVYGVLAAWVFIFNVRQSAIVAPKIIWLPVGLGSVLVVQWLLGMFAYQSSAVGLLGYLLWAALLMVLGANLAQCYGREWLVLRLAWFILWGALINAAIGIMQLLHWEKPLGGLAMNINSGQGIFGNLAQQNHYATQISIGLLSAGLLFFSKCISRVYFICISLCFLIVIFMSGSRMGLLYAGFIVVLFWAMYSCIHRQTWKHIKRFLFLGLAIIAVFSVVFVWLPTSFFSVQLERWNHINTAFGPRIYLWMHALYMFKSHPFLGVGFEDFADHLFHQAAQLRSNPFWGLDKSAHNIFFHLLAVSGVVGFLTFILPLGIFYRQQLTQVLTLERLWLLGLLGIILIHSLLEQPLFYAYFLGFSALIIGVADNNYYQYEFTKKIRALFCSLLFLLTGLLIMAGWDYVDFSRQQKKITANDIAGRTIAKNRMVDLGNRSFLAPYVELNYANFFISPASSPKNKLTFSQRVLRFSPIPEAEIRHSLYLFDNGKIAESLEYFSEVSFLYPVITQKFIHDLSQHPAGYEKWLELINSQ